MADLASVFESLPSQFVTLEARVAFTVSLLGGLLVLGWFLWQWAERLKQRISSRAVEAGLITVLSAVVLIVGTALIVVWDVVDPTIGVLRSLHVTVANGMRLAFTFALLAGTYAATGVIERAVDELVSSREQFSRHQREVTFRIVTVVLYIAAIIVVLGIWNIDLGGLLVGAGFLGIVVGMAARQTLGSMIAGFVLMFARPFEIGDWVEIGEEEGIVTDITIVNTRIETFDGEYVMIPNDTVSSTTITNRARKGRLRLHVEVGIDYTADPDRAMEVAAEQMNELDDVLTVPQPQADTVRFGDSAVVLELRFWIDKPSARRKWRARTAVIRTVKEAFDEAGINIPYPQRELSRRSDEDSSVGFDGERAMSDGGNR